VVNISTTQKVTVDPLEGTPFQGQGPGPVRRTATSLGSGFIISADGYIVTNNHVISAGVKGAVVESITVTLADRREFKATLVGRDVASDLALLKIDATGLPFVKFGDSAKARVGDWVVAIGNPFGLGGSVTAGIISAVHRVTGTGGANDRYIQTDASINRGNSGGPMFDLAGNVIGINSQILSPTGGNIGIGFAIPAEEAAPIVAQLMKGATVQRGYLGVAMQDVDADVADALGIPKDRGTLITRVEPNGAAAKAGVQQGDVIVKVNGQDVTPEQTLSYLVGALKPGAKVPLEIVRDGKPVRVTVTVAARPSEDQLAAAQGNGFNPGDDTPAGPDALAAVSLGIKVLPLTPDIAQALRLPNGLSGVVINAIDPSSDAAAKGLQPGDLISSVNGTPVTTGAQIAAVVTAAKKAGRGRVLLYVQRGPNARYIPIDITG
jgi:serine protease Do